MHPQQKAAWFILVVFIGTFALYVLAIPLLSWQLHRPWSAVAGPAMGIFGLFGLYGFAHFFYRPARDGKAVVDERDHLLSVRAWRTGMAAFWLLFVFGCVGSWAFLRYVRGMDHITLPVEFFPCLVFVGTMIAVVTQAIATLHYYGWRPSDAAPR